MKEENECCREKKQLGFKKKRQRLTATLITTTETTREAEKVIKIELGRRSVAENRETVDLRKRYKGKENSNRQKWQGPDSNLGLRRDREAI